MKSLKFAALASLALALPQFGWAQNSPYQLSEPFQIAQSSSTVEQQRSAPAPIAPPEPQRWAVAIGGLYTHRQGETAGWAPNVEANYSATDRLQLHAMAPYAYDRVAGGRTHFGIGDVEAGVRYRFVDDDPNGWRPAVAFYPLVDFPTGKRAENLGTGRLHAFLPLWLSKSVGGWIPYAGGGYWINPGVLNKNWFFGAAGVVRPINEQWSVTGEIFHASSSKFGLRDQTGFDVGARFNVSANHHLVLTVGRGLQNVDETNQVTGYLAYVLTF